jgi:hypothetical protein
MGVGHEWYSMTLAWWLHADTHSLTPFSFIHLFTIQVLYTDNCSVLGTENIKISKAWQPSRSTSQRRMWNAHNTSAQGQVLLEQDAQCGVAQRRAQEGQPRAKLKGVRAALKKSNI